MSVRSSGSNKKDGKESAGKIAAVPVKNLKNDRGSQRALTVNSKIREDCEDNRRITRKNTAGGRKGVTRKRGKIT